MRLSQRGDRVWEGSGIRGSREVRGNGTRKSIYESGRRRKMHESKNLLICSVSLEIKDLRQESKVYEMDYEGAGSLRLSPYLYPSHSRF